MSEPSHDQMWEEFREEIGVKCFDYYLTNFRRMPTDEERDAFWEDTLDGDLRTGEQ